MPGIVVKFISQVCKRDLVSDENGISLNFVCSLASFVPLSSIVISPDKVTRKHSPVLDRTQNRPKERNDQILLPAAKSRFSGRAPPKANNSGKGGNGRMELITRGGCNRKLRRVSVSSKAPAGYRSVSQRAASGNVPRASIRNALTNAGISLLRLPPRAKTRGCCSFGAAFYLCLSLSLPLVSPRFFAALHTHSTKPNKPRYSSWDCA